MGLRHMDPSPPILCSNQGKRLCTEDEWTFACEGEEAWPYPYGYTRSQDMCVIDRSARDYDERAWTDSNSGAAMLELDSVWQGEPSGSRATCRSPFRRVRHDGQRR